MDTRQVVERVANLLRSRKWGGSGSPVFHPNSVIVGTTTVVRAVEARATLPVVIVSPGAARADPEAQELPDIYTEDIFVEIGVEQGGDRFGTAALLGANRESATSSKGRGLLDIQRELFAAIRALGHRDGVTVKFEAASGGIPQGNQKVGMYVSRQFVFSARLTTETTFEAPRALVLSEAGGTVTIDWEAPDTTTDLIDYVVRRVAGRTPVAYSDQGTSAATVSAGTTIANDTPGAGTWTYSVFARYADRGGSIANNVSDFAYATIEVS